MAENLINTKERIITESAKLFAIRNFSTVSVKDIASAVNIKTGSLYNHFKSKEDILETILLRFSKNYIRYFENEKLAIEKETCLEKILNIMFSSLRTIDNSFMYYGMTIIMKEQFHNKLANELASKLFYTDSINYLKAYFDFMVKNKIAKPCDTKSIATFLMFSILIGTQIRIQKSENENYLVDVDNIYENLYNFIMNSLKN